MTLNVLNIVHSISDNQRLFKLDLALYIGWYIICEVYCSNLIVGNHYRGSYREEKIVVSWCSPRKM